MDLELVGKKMLEALAVRGLVSSMETKVLGISEQIKHADGAVQQAKANKLSAVDKRKKSEESVTDALVKASEARQEVTKAELKLKTAVDWVESKKVELSNYNDTALAQLDAVTSKKEEDKKTVEESYKVAFSKLEEARQDLESRQAELKSDGIEFNLTPSRVPKTTTL